MSLAEHIGMARALKDPEPLKIAWWRVSRRVNSLIKCLPVVILFARAQ